MMSKFTREFRMVLLGSASIMLIAGAAPAAAQEPAAAPGDAPIQADQPAPQEDRSATDVDQAEIVITAQKRQEKILDIPQSVTVVSGDTLERQQATTFSQYLNEIPGLSLNQSEPGVGRLVLRGVNTGGVSSTVSVYIDETPFGSSSGQVNGAILAGDFDTFDVARIEVLRGPQGTLYGASSLGGVLKFVTNTPKLGDFSGRVRAGIDSVDHGGIGYNVNGVVNVPLGSTVAFRGSGFYRRNAGWIDGTGNGANFLGIPAVGGKDINESDVYGGRGSLLFKPSEPLTIRVTAIAQQIKSDASSFVDARQGSYKPIDGKYRQTTFFREPNKLEYRLYNGEIGYDFGFANLLSSTSFGKNNQSFRDDLTAPFGLLVNFLFGPLNPNVPGFPFPQLTTDPIGLYQDQETNLRKFTQEVRLASPSNDRFEWMVGGYYTNERGKIDQSIPGINLTTGQQFNDPILGSLATALLTSRYRELAGFTNGTFHFTDRFDITAGARLSDIRQRTVQSSTGVLANGGSPPTQGKSKESVFTYSLSPRFEINDHSAVYARIAKGYRPGGPNILPPTAGPDVPRAYDADTIVSYEIGFKTDVGRRLSLDLAAYHLDWKDIQLFTVIDNFGLNANGGKAVSNGIEGTLTLRPSRGLRLSANGAYIDAHLTQDTPPFVGGFKGNRLPYTPKISVSLNGDYEWKLGGSTTAYVGGSLRLVGKQRDNFIAGEITGIDPVTGDFTFAFTPQRRIPSYATLDLRAGVQFGRYSIDAFARNVNNSRGVQSLNLVTDQLTGGNALPNDAIRAALLRPRTIGITLGAEF
ncbi:MAG: TonB-dependent receptor [Sphingomicrobium sp.]